MEQNEIEKAAEKRYGITETKINCIQRACFRAGSEWHKESITAEDVKRWYQILLGLGEDQMKKDIIK